MQQQGGNHAIMFDHDMETLLEGGPMISGGSPFVQIVNERKVGVVERMAFFHDTDAPVKISREAILQVVWHRLILPCKESLVADQHPLSETFPVQVIGGRKAAHPQEMPFFVYNGSFSVDDIGQRGMSGQ